MSMLNISEYVSIGAVGGLGEVHPSFTRFLRLRRSEQRKDIKTPEQSHIETENIYGSLLKMNDVLNDIDRDCARFWEELVLSEDTFKDMLIQNRSPLFMERIDAYLKDFDDTLKYFAQIRIQEEIHVVHSVKNNACPSTLQRYEIELRDKTTTITTIRNSGASNS
jgi:hypothetical protein